MSQHLCEVAPSLSMKGLGFAFSCFDDREPELNFDFSGEACGEPSVNWVAKADGGRVYVCARHWDLIQRLLAACRKLQSNTMLETYEKNV
jgi:hypothetical protein